MTALFAAFGATAEVLYERADPLDEWLPTVDASVLAQPLEPVKWLSRGLSLAHGRPLLLSGYGSAGKTWAALELALAVAAGEARVWGEQDLSLAGPVLGIDYEMGLSALRWRLQRLAHGRGIDLGALGPSLKISSLPKLLLTDPRAEDLLLRACEGKALVVIDNNAAGSRGIDENSAEAAESLYTLNRVGEKTGAVIVVLAHERKGGEGQAQGDAARRIRGSSSLHAAVGGGVAFSRVCKGVVKGESSKSSLGPEPEPFFFSLDDVGEIDPATGKPRGIRLSPVAPEELARRLEEEREERERASSGKTATGVAGAKLALLKAVATSGPLSRTEALSLVSGRGDYKSQAWQQLLDEGAVVQSGVEGAKKLFSVPGEAAS